MVQEVKGGTKTRTEEETQKQANDFEDILINLVGKGKQHENIQDLAYELYKETIKQDKNIRKLEAYKALVHQASSSFHTKDFNSLEFDGRWLRNKNK